jgi:PAS domain S-box-containing protein
MIHPHRNHERSNPLARASTGAGLPPRVIAAVSRLANWAYACCLQPPAFPDDVERTRQAASLQPILLASFVGAALYLVSTLFQRPGLAQDTAPYVVPLLIGLPGLGWISRRGHPWTASWLLTVGLTCLLGFSAATTDGARSPAYLVSVDVILIAGLLLGVRAALGFSTVFALLGAGFIAADYTGWVTYPRYLHSPSVYFFSLQLVVLVALAVVQLAGRDVRSALDRARAEIRQRLAVQARLQFRLELGAILASVSAAFISASEREADGLVIGGLTDLQSALSAKICLLESANGEKGPPTGGSVWSNREAQVNPALSMIGAIEPFLPPRSALTGWSPHHVRPDDPQSADLWNLVSTWGPELSVVVLIPVISAAGAEGLLAIGWDADTEPLQEDVLVQCRTLAEIILNGLHRISIEATLQQSLNELRRAQENNLDLDRRFQRLFRDSADAVYISERDGQIVEFNPAACRLFNIPHERATELNATELYAHPEDRIRLQEALELNGSLHNYPVKLRSTDGSVLDCLLTSSVRRSRDGTVSGYQGIIRDVTAEHQRQEMIELHIRRLEAMNRIGQAISANTDSHVTYDILLAEVLRLLEVDAADILDADPDSRLLTFGASRGFRTDALKHSQLRFGESLAGQSAATQREVHISNLADTDSFDRSPLFSDEEFISYCGLPLVAKGRVCGVLEVFTRSALAPNPSWWDTARDFAAQAAIAIDSSRMFADLERSNRHLIQAYDETLEGWAKAHDLRDHETVGHSKRVAEITVRLAQELGVPPHELVHIYRGALLHDIGKLAIPDAILRKPGPLSEDEWQIMRQHPIIAEQLLEGNEHLQPAMSIPRYHHEHWDGSGYPWGLEGDGIPLPARIFSVVDVWDALRSDRPYREAWTKERALAYIQLRKSSQLDPTVVDQFLAIVGEFDAFYSESP